MGLLVGCGGQERWGGGGSGGWVVIQWSLKVQCDGKNIFGLDG